MALRARLVPPPPPAKTEWPWHSVKTGSIPVSALFAGDRRLEAETYLSTGYGIRTAIEAKTTGWVKLSELAGVIHPGRMKGILVSPEYGKPFLAATQVFDVRPVPRKFLALEKMEGAAACYVEDGHILVTRSGSVGRPAMANSAHRGIVVSDDLLRIYLRDERNRGWLYAYLHAAQTRAMTVGSHYGHIIKHLEPSHVDALPVPVVDDDTAARFNRQVRKILELRNRGYSLTLEAEDRFEKALGPLAVKDWGEKGFTVHASRAFMSGRRRFDATSHNPGVEAIRKHLSKHGQGFVSVAAAGYEVWLPNRFRRVPAPDGVVLVESAALTEVNPDLAKVIADGDFGDPYRGRIQAGWILMARSGQTYGILGTAVLAEEDLEGKVITDDIIRIKPKREVKIKPGYLVTALSHPLFGRPVVKALAYGSSIPHIDVGDLLAHEIVRLKDKDEDAIAELAAAAAKARAAADITEREIASEAAAIIDRFITHAP
jgi:hypothetical protein